MTRALRLACALAVLSSGCTGEIYRGQVPDELELYESRLSSMSPAEACQDLLELCESTARGCLAHDVFCTTNSTTDKVCADLEELCRNGSQSACGAHQRKCASSAPKPDSGAAKPDTGAPSQGTQPTPDQGAQPTPDQSVPPAPDTSAPVVYDLIVRPGDVVKNQGGTTVYSGSDAIQWALNNGTTVRVAAGTYQVAGAIYLRSGNSLIGEGSRSTTLNFSSGSIRMVSVDNTTVKGFHLTGAVSLKSGSHNGATRRNHLWEDIWLDHNDEGDYPYAVVAYLAENSVIDGLTYRNVIVDSPRMGGFFNNSDNGSGCWLRNVLYENCQALRVGVDAPDHLGHSGAFAWLPGFDLAERANVDRMTLISCRADYNYEAGFHFEDDPAHTNVVFKNCTANYNGQKPANFVNPDGWSVGTLYGAGFFMGAKSKQATISGLETCTGTGNAKGLVLFDEGA